jgi:hypothetical protein
MKRTAALWCGILVLALSAFPAAAMGGSPGSGGIGSDAERQELSVSKIVLFSTGLAYFQRTGIVENDASVDLRFKTKDVNDLLKSMILQDIDGGTISSVNYSSREPLNVTLRSMSIDLSGNPGISGILTQLRGEEIILDTANGGGVVKGTIIGVENVTNREGRSTPTLNIYGKRGITGIRLESIQAVRFADPFLDAEFRKALQLLTDAKSADEKRVSFEFSGEGRRRVLVGYLLEAPVWKTSYRLVLGEEDEHDLQGWAIVENTTDEDWTEIDLSLVSGRPVSFTMDLYSPIYNRRPSIRIETAAALAPKQYEAPARATSRAMLSPAPSMAAIPQSESYGDFGGFDDFDVELDVSQGVDSAATTERAGEFFHYTIEHTVSLPRKESAMVPIVDETIEGERISIYNPSGGSVHPLNGLRFTNTTEIDLMGGPLTVFESGTYAGDSQIGPVYAGDERIISFSMDLGTTIKGQVRGVPTKLVGVEIEEGILLTETLSRQETVYSLSSRGLRERRVLMEHPVLPGWKLVEPEKPDERTASFYRFTVDLPVGVGSVDASSELLVAVERTDRQITDLLGAHVSFIQVYLDSDFVENSIKVSLRGILDRRKRLDDTAALRRARENRRATIFREQDRIRRNMENLETDTDLYRQYVDTLTDQEEELLALEKRIEELIEQEQNQRLELESYVRSLQTH